MPAFPSNAIKGHCRVHILHKLHVTWAVSRDWGGCGDGEVKPQTPSFGGAILSRRLGSVERRGG